MSNRKLEILQRQKKLESMLVNKLTHESSPINFRNAYDQIHEFFLRYGNPATGNHPGFIYRKKINYIDRLFLRTIGKGNMILEIGCGNGIFSKKLSQENNSVIALDISNIALRIAKKNKTIS